MMNIEAKRSRPQADDAMEIDLTDDDRDWITRDARDSYYYARAMAEHGGALAYVWYRNEASLIARLATEAVRAGDVSAATHLEIDLAATSWDAVLRDVTYLAIFSSATSLDVRDSRDDRPERLDRVADPPLPAVLAGRLPPALRHLHIRTLFYVVTDMTREFRMSLGNLISLRLECPLQLASPRVLLEDRYDMPSVYAKARADDGAADLHSLALLHLGATNMHARDLDAHESSVDDSFFVGLTALKTLMLTNIKLARLAPIPRIAPALQELHIAFCALTVIPPSWHALAPTLTELHLTNTTLAVFDAERFYPFTRLEVLAIGNDDDAVADGLYHPGYGATLRGQELRLHGMPLLRELRFENMEIATLVLATDEIDDPEVLTRRGPGDAGILSPTFGALKDLMLMPGAPIRVEPGAGRLVGQFLPSLESLYIGTDNMWQRNAADWYFAHSMHFPTWLFGVFSIQEYTGPQNLEDMEQLTLSLDEWVPTDRVFDTNGIDLDEENPGMMGPETAYLKLVYTVARTNEEFIRLTASNAIVLSVINAAYDLDEMAPMPQRVQQIPWNPAMEEDDAMPYAPVTAEPIPPEPERPLAPVPETAAAALPDYVQRSLAARREERSVVPRSRAAPYFVRYDGSLLCAYDPFGAGDECLLCGMPFSRAMHDADPAPVADNGFLSARNELELPYALGQRGCVVMCNVLASDFDANGYVVQDGETHAAAVRRTQCDHRQHAFHRLCYAIALHEQFLAQNTYHPENTSDAFHCPMTRLRFAPAPGETPAVLLAAPARVGQTAVVRNESGARLVVHSAPGIVLHGPVDIPAGHIATYRAVSLTEWST